MTNESWTSEWLRTTDEALSALAALHRPRKLAKLLGTTPSAVIGRLQRLRRKGWSIPNYRRPNKAASAGGSPLAAAGAQTIRRRRKGGHPLSAAGKRTKQPSLGHFEPPPEPEKFKARAEPAVTMRKLGLMKLGRLTCRWPVGAPGAADFCFCGNPKPDNRAYCEPHHDFAHVERRGARL